MHLRRLAALLTLSIGSASCNRTQSDRPRSELPDASTATVASAQPIVPSSKPLPKVDSVILITVDAMRADQPWTGYDKVTTPHLTQLARRSIVYTRAYALANLTTASVNALLASRYPSELNRNMCTIGCYAIPGSLAPTLQAAGVETMAAHGHAIFAGHTAPSVGFDQWKLIRGASGRLQTMGATTGNEIAQEMILGLPRLDSKRKRFNWSHFVDPHHTYVAHPKHETKSTGARGRYDSEIGYTDAAIGSVLKAIEENGMTKNTAIVVTGDHGEAFGEHGFTEHGFSVFEEEIHVPLILHIPGVEPREIHTPRSAIDIAPTIAELLGVTPPSSWRGVSLSHDFDQAQQPALRLVIVDVPEMQNRIPLRVAIRDNIKVMFTGEAAQVFDLTLDPGEKAALSGESARLAIERARQDLKVIGVVAGTPCLEGKARNNSKGDL